MYLISYRSRFGLVVNRNGVESHYTELHRRSDGRAFVVVGIDTQTHIFVYPCGRVDLLGGFTGYDIKEEKFTISQSQYHLYDPPKYLGEIIAIEKVSEGEAQCLLL